MVEIELALLIDWRRKTTDLAYDWIWNYSYKMRLHRINKQLEPSVSMQSRSGPVGK